MKKSERLKPRIKIKFKYFILAHMLTLFFALVFLLLAERPIALAAENIFSSEQKNAYSEPFSKLIEFLNEKKDELAEKQNSFLNTKNSLQTSKTGADNLPNLSVGQTGSSLLSAVFDSVRSFVVDNPKQYLGTVFDSVKSFVFPGKSQNNFEYNSPGNEEKSKEIENLKQQYEQAINETSALSQKFSLLQNEMEKIKNSGVIVREPIIEQRVVEKTIEKIASGLSQTDLDSSIASVRAELNNLNINLTNQINNLSAQSSRQNAATYQAVSLTNRIDSLSGTRLSNVTVSGVSGLTDSDIPDNITASNYLPLTGGTITGSTTINGQTNLSNATTSLLTVSSGAWFSSGNVGIGTSSPYAKLSVVGPVAAEYFYATSTTATSTFSGQTVAGFAPTLAHSFGSWSVGSSGANPLGASLIINPSSAAPDSNLLSLSVSGSAKFLVDAEGDVFANSVTAVGGTTLSTTTASTFSVENNTHLGDATTTDITYFNSRIADSLIPTADNLLDLGDPTNWLRWRTGYFGTSVGIGGTATSTGTQLTTSGSYLIDSGNTLSVNTTNNKTVSFGTGNISLPYASSTALTVSGSTYLTGLGQGWLHTAGGVNSLTSSTSPTVNYITATSTTATSTFPYLSVSTNSNLGTVVGGTWNGTAIGDAYLTKSGDWTGTFNGQNGAYYLSRTNHTGTQGVSTLSNYDWTFSNNYGAINLTASSTKPLWAQGGINASSTSNFVYASSTALTISGNSYLGTISSGAWNGTAVSNQYGGTGLDSSALTGIAQITAGTWSASSTLSTAYGGTGWSSIAAGYIPYGNGAGRLATSTSLYWDNGNSRLGIGTTTPDSKLTIYDTSKAALEFSGAGNSTYKWTMGLDMADAGKFKIASSTALGTLDRFTIDGNGYIGIGTSTPGRRLDVADSGNNNPQMRLSRETNVYTDFSVAQTTGDLSLNLNGTNANNVSLYAQGNTGANLWVCEGAACPSVTLSDGGNIVVERDIKYPTSGRMKRTVVLTAAGAIIPTSGGATKTQVDGANSSYYVLDFGQTSTTSAFWQWTIPDSYDGGVISATYYWFTTVTSGGVSWCSQTNGVNTAGDINAALSNAVCDTTSNNVPTGAANTLATTTQSSLSSNFHPGEAVTFKVSRGVDNTNDTAAANARLYMIKLKYGVATESD